MFITIIMKFEKLFLIEFYLIYSIFKRFLNLFFVEKIILKFKKRENICLYFKIFNRASKNFKSLKFNFIQNRQPLF